MLPCNINENRQILFPNTHLHFIVIVFIAQQNNNKVHQW